ncbi:MAG: 4Fe-4S dicluster domain-containing protein [Armatimonadetes bacterium]|nr:4Fe-4S dicluster domain-containing protein [Armatimonadota bacterium]
MLIAAERCKGCGLCVAVCPPEIMELGSLNRLGYAVVRVTDQARCTSCTACALVCPEVAITVMRPQRARQTREGAK